jgi:hypothetical protein
MAHEERLSITGIAGPLDLDRKTIRRCLKQAAWRSYQRPARTDTLLAEHADFLRERAITAVTKEATRADAISRHESCGDAPTPNVMTQLCSPEGAGAA